MGLFQTTIEKTPDTFSARGVKTSGGWGVSTIISGGIVLWLGYLLLAGAVAWNTQLQILAVIGVIIFFLMKRRR